MREHLPPTMARCEPTGCRQASNCARCQDRTEDEAEVVDASLCLSTDPRVWCPMFIDWRGLALIPEAV